MANRAPEAGRAPRSEAGVAAPELGFRRIRQRANGAGRESVEQARNQAPGGAHRDPLGRHSGHLRGHLDGAVEIADLVDQAELDGPGSEPDLSSRELPGPLDGDAAT